MRAEPAVGNHTAVGTREDPAASQGAMGKLSLYSVPTAPVGVGRRISLGGPGGVPQNYFYGRKNATCDRSGVLSCAFDVRTPPAKTRERLSGEAVTVSGVSVARDLDSPTPLCQLHAQKRPYAIGVQCGGAQRSGGPTTPRRKIKNAPTVGSPYKPSLLGGGAPGASRATGDVTAGRNGESVWAFPVHHRSNVAPFATSFGSDHPSASHVPIFSPTRAVNTECGRRPGTFPADGTE